METNCIELRSLIDEINERNFLIEQRQQEPIDILQELGIKSYA